MKRAIPVIVLCFLLCLTTAATASLASLENALGPVFHGKGAVKTSVKLTVNTLMPFDDIRLDLINRVLKHTQLDLFVDETPDDAATGFRLIMAGAPLFEMTERHTGGAYLVQSSLLPNRMLFSTNASPMDMLLVSQEEVEVVDEDSKDPNTSDVEEAFDMLSAVEELKPLYQTLTDQTVPLTEENKVRYKIDDIGTGRFSYVAKLTEEQCQALAPDLRKVISCGMDAEYREELAQVTFERRFTVALYKDEDGNDVCLYIRGTIVYPDGDRRSLKWQWGFTPDLKTQTFLYRVSRNEGRRDTRNIDAILEQTQSADAYTLACETTTNLRRGGRNEKSTLTIDLSGTPGSASTCQGSISRQTGGTDNSKDMDKRITDVTVDCSLQAGETSALLTGDLSYQQTINRDVITALDLHFEQAQQPEQDDDAASELAPYHMPTDAPVPDLDVEPLLEALEHRQTEDMEYLVGSPPIGLYAYDIPDEIISVNMDNMQTSVHQSMFNEAGQRLAGNLVLALLNLPAEDAGLLADGMQESDYAIFLEMLD